MDFALPLAGICTLVPGKFFRDVSDQKVRRDKERPMANFGFFNFYFFWTFADRAVKDGKASAA